MSVLGLGAATIALTSPTAPSEPADRPEPEATLTARSSEQPYRAFSADSWWNTPLPPAPPQHPAEDEVLNYLSTAPESGGGCLTLAGAGDSPWGHPIYWAEPGDPEYDVTGPQVPVPELAELRIPSRAQPASNNDGTMSIFDLQKKYVVALTNAEYDADDDEWSAAGATVTYLDSNGLHESTEGSDEPRNVGSHRGNNGATMAARWDLVEAGEIPHVLKIASGPEIADRAVFPMIGSDGDYHGSDPGVPAQGTRLRIKPSVDLDSLDLSPEALVIARALQDYGAYLGDSGGVTALKLENTVAEGRGQLWDVSADALCHLPLSPEFWDVVAEGYDPTTDR